MTNVDSWIPVQYGPDVIIRPDTVSAIMSQVEALPMSSESRVVSRSGSSRVTAVQKNGAWPTDSATNDTVTLTAVKFGLEYDIANEDLNDSLTDIIATKKKDFARGFAQTFDNACLGITAVGNGSNAKPFNSLYYTLTQNDTNTGYTANTNYIASATGSVVTYDNLNSLLGKVEANDWYDPTALVFVAHPTLLSTIRGIKDTQGHPIFVAGGFGQPGGVQNVDSLFGRPLVLSWGAKTNGDNQVAPVGNPLIFAINPQYLQRGEPEGVMAYVDKSVSIKNDQTSLIFRAREAFVVSTPAAHAVLEVKP